MWVFILITIAIFLVSGLPLYFAVKLLGGKTTLLLTAFITLIGAVIISIIEYFFKVWGGLIAFIVLIWIYRESFKLKWWKAFVAWFLQLIFLIIISTVLALLGVSMFIVSL